MGCSIGSTTVNPSLSVIDATWTKETKSFSTTSSGTEVSYTLPQDSFVFGLMPQGSGSSWTVNNVKVNGVSIYGEIAMTHGAQYSFGWCLKGTVISLGVPSYGNSNLQLHIIHK